MLWRRRDAPPSLAAAGGGERVVAGAAHHSGLPTKASGLPRSDQHQQHASRPKRQRGATATAAVSGDGEESNGERSRRRLAAFLEGQASAATAAAAGTARQGFGSPKSPPRAVMTVAGGRGGCSDGGAVGGGGRDEQGQPCHERIRCGAACRLVGKRRCAKDTIVYIVTYYSLSTLRYTLVVGNRVLICSPCTGWVILLHREKSCCECAQQARETSRARCIRDSFTTFVAMT